MPQNLQQCFDKALRLEASLQSSEGVNTARRTTVMNQQAQSRQSSLDSYDPVVGKWMTNLVATTPITAKAMKNLYAELNRQKI